MLMGSIEPQNECELVNVNSHTLGVVGYDTATKLRVVAPLIPKNTPLPHRAAKTFQTAKANQRNVKVAIVEGESTRPEQCIALGECIIRELPSNLPAKTKVQVEYRYDESGRISIRARIPEARQSAEVEIDRGQSNLQDLDTWRRRLFGDADESEPMDDSESPVSKLDALLVKVGRAALKHAPTPQVQAEWTAASNAIQAFKQAQASWEDANNSLAAQGGRISVSDSAQLASLEQAVRDQSQQARFACLVLGRECANRWAVPAEAEGLLPDIRRLQEQIS
jgi:molecular chaperone DnaK (HSP70)